MEIYYPYIWRIKNSITIIYIYFRLRFAGIREGIAGVSLWRSRSEVIMMRKGGYKVPIKTIMSKNIT